MSVYECKDVIEAVLADRDIPNLRDALVMSKFSLHQAPKKPTKITEHDRQFLQEIDKDLSQLISMEDLEDEEATANGSILNSAYEQLLVTIIEKIQKHRQHCSHNLKKILDEIHSDLEIVKNGKNTTFLMADLLEPQLPTYCKYIELTGSDWCIDKFSQGSMKQLGKSKGECYGFTMSMADPDLSIYKKEGKKQVRLNRDIHNYQKNQSDREKDQQKIKRTRLTIQRFCPSIKKQAEELYQFAKQHQGTELSINLEATNVGKHATYLHILPNGNIQYMDPNHGAFLFTSKAEFLFAYELIYTHQKNKYPNLTFKYYEISKLEEDTSGHKKESITLWGKIRTLLTGRKYPNQSWWSAYWPGLLKSIYGVFEMIDNVIEKINPKKARKEQEDLINTPIVIPSINKMTSSTVAMMKQHVALAGKCPVIARATPSESDEPPTKPPSKSKPLDEFIDEKKPPFSLS